MYNELVEEICYKPYVSFFVWDSSSDMRPDLFSKTFRRFKLLSEDLHYHPFVRLFGNQRFSFFRRKSILAFAAFNNRCLWTVGYKNCLTILTILIRIYHEANMDKPFRLRSTIYSGLGWVCLFLYPLISSVLLVRTEAWKNLQSVTDTIGDNG